MTQNYATFGFVPHKTKISGSESFTRWLAPGSELGASWEQAGTSWSKGSEMNVILGFRVPTTIGLRKPPAGSPCSQLAPLAPRASLGPWSLWGARGYGQGGSKLAPSLLPASQLTPACSSSLPAFSSLPACSSLLPSLQLAPLAPSLLPSLQLAPLAPARSQLAPAHSPHSSSLPAHSPRSQLAPAHSPCSSSLPACSQWSKVFSMFLGSPPPLGGSRG